MTSPWIIDTLVRVSPILLFLLGITIISELADLAGVFTAAGARAARAGRGSVARLWFIIVALAAVTTIFLSLDTTAVLLTPVVLALARRLGIAAWPFALATVWLANTASLVLPVSNLTNLLLVDRLNWSFIQYVHHMWIPSLVAITASIVILWFLFRTSLRGTYSPASAGSRRDAWLFYPAVAVCLAVGPLVIVGIAPWLVSLAGSVVLLLAYLLRKPSLLSWNLLPWRLMLITLGLFMVVGFFQQHGLSELLTSLAGTGQQLPDLLRLVGTATVGSNLVNNLPTYMALEPVAASSPTRMLVLLAGTNLGPLITVWGSLATLLWLERCRSYEIKVSQRSFAAAGIIGVPILIFSTTLAIWALA